MRQVTHGTMTTVYPDYAVWKQERNFCIVMGAARVRVKYPATGATLYSATFVAGVDGRIEIDLSDLMRVYATGTIRFEDPSSATATRTDVDWNVVGLINPDHLIIPPFAEQYVPNAIVAPQYMLRAIADVPSLLEFYAHYSGDGLELRSVSGNIGGAVIERSTYIIPATAGMRGFYRGQNFNRKMLAHECGKLYAAVQWISRSGAKKRHTWEVVKVTDATVDSYEIERLDNGYDVRKGQVKSCKLVLNNLNDYDYWYYSDIVTSSDVRVALTAEDYQFDGDTLKDICRVEVTDKKVQQLDGNAGKLSRLEINVNFRRYDAI